ncbi:MAG TPA: A/G-specific adenine glycosylase [Candidatus Angelobacter sp.]|nr:A/G-specific adenine glycosylase [Candidatus Angelobacter sp.]
MNKLMEKTQIQRQLLEWYRTIRRDLPWRRTKDPYYIWVSEVMLQQTQVDTVIPYYNRFITQFPTMEDLAKAREETVLKLWEGLGYYSRARNLQAGVKEVVENYMGEIPTERSEILKIKGIGPYTSGAILSIAFNKSEPAVDGNVMRVLSRLFLIKDDIAKPKTRQTFEQLLYDLIPDNEASDFNQALMELGALVCKPKQPKCDECPLANGCMANIEGAQSAYPVKSKKTKTTKKAYQVLLLKDTNGCYLVHQRPENGLLASLWEFPMLQGDDTITKDQLKLWMVKELGMESLDTPQKLDQTLTHTFSHLEWHLNVWVLTGAFGHRELPPSYRLLNEEELSTLPFPVAHQKIWEYASPRLSE